MSDFCLVSVLVVTQNTIRAARIAERANVVTASERLIWYCWQALTPNLNAQS